MRTTCHLLLAAPVMIWFSSSVIAVEPLLTTKNARELEGHSAVLEITVAEVKFAERRRLLFLSSSGNFRSPENQAVAIAADDLPKFREAGDDLAARHVGRKIRARGKVVRDEGQWLLIVSEPGQIELLHAPAVRPAPQKDLVILSQAQETRLPLPLPAELPRRMVTIDHEGRRDVYEGVPLAALLERAEVILGAEARGSALLRYAVVSAADKYQALVSLAEIDPYYADAAAIVAERLNDQPLSAEEGPLLLVLAADKHHRRWVRRVARIEVRSAAGERKD